MRRKDASFVFPPGNPGQARCITDVYTYYYFGRAALLFCRLGPVVVSTPVSRLASLHLSLADVVASLLRPTLFFYCFDGLVIYFRVIFNLIYSSPFPHKHIISSL